MIQFNSTGIPKFERIGAMNKAPVISITPAVHDKMSCYVDLVDGEIGWMGTVQILPSGAFLIDEVYLIEQEVSAATTDLSEEGLAKFGEALMNEEGGIEKLNRLKFWGHSHVNMEPNPSGTDDSTMDDFAENGNDFFIRGIFNKKGKVRFDVFYFDKGFAFMDVKWYLHREFNADKKSIEEEIEEKVTEKVYANHYPHYPQYNKHNQYQKNFQHNQRRNYQDNLFDDVDDIGGEFDAEFGTDYVARAILKEELRIENARNKTLNMLAKRTGKKPKSTKMIPSKVVTKGGISNVR